MIELDAEQARRAIVEHTRRLAEAAAFSGPDCPIPTAAEWTITDLVEHVGQSQCWVAEIIERRITDPTQLPTQMAVLPDDPAMWSAWLTESAQRIANACSDDAIDAPVFNAAADGRTGTQFWMCSALNEAVVHGFDAENAAGRPADIAPAIAAALIGNHLAMLTSPTWAMQRPESAHAIRGTGETLQLRATDTKDDTGSWFVELTPDGARWHPKTQQADVTVSGPAQSLLLIMTRRLSLDDQAGNHTSAEGDIELARHWIANTPHVSG